MRNYDNEIIHCPLMFNGSFTPVFVHNLQLRNPSTVRCHYESEMQEGMMG
jgi:hypothetical protein